MMIEGDDLKYKFIKVFPCDNPKAVLLCVESEY